jgi:histidinol-phosphate aminotransferase
VRLPDPVPLAIRSLDAPFVRRLDLLPNPYGPSPRVFDAMANLEPSLRNPDHFESCVRERLARDHGVPPSWIVTASGIEELLLALLLWRRRSGPVAVFPPTDDSFIQLAAKTETETIEVARTERFQIEIDRDGAAPFPRVSTAFVMSPNDPTGTILDIQDAVRLTRRSSLIVVDERHVRYALRSSLPLVREFENVLVLRTLETWAGLTSFPFAYAIARPKLGNELKHCLLRASVLPSSLIAANATLDDSRYLDATIERIQIEKSRLFRTLRKLNMIRPYPSWGNFVLARVERGDRAAITRGLRERGIAVHAPSDEAISSFLRISAVSPDATLVLKQALIDIAVDL